MNKNSSIDDLKAVLKSKGFAFVLISPEELEKYKIDSDNVEYWLEECFYNSIDLIKEMDKG